MNLNEGNQKKQKTVLGEAEDKAELGWEGLGADST